MKSLLVVILSLSVVLSAYSQENRCEELGDLVSEARILSENMGVEELSKADYQILLYGENHADVKSRTYISNLIGDIQGRTEKKIECVFLEFPVNYQRKIKQVLQGEDSFENFIRSIRPTIDGIPEEAIEYLQGEMKKFLEPILKMAREHNIQVIPVDDEQEAIELNKDSEYLIGERTKIFADNILDYLSSGQCHKAVFIVGAAHIGTASFDGKYLSLNEILREANLNTLSILSSSAKEDTLNPIKRLEDCKEAIVDNETHENYFFKLQNINEHKKAFPILNLENHHFDSDFNNTWRTPFFSDYDYIFINH